MVVTLSVMVQVTFFKVTRRLTGTGKRIFRMAPLHHHFEMLGWEQVTVVIRFWIITGLCVAAGLGIFYAEWVAGQLSARPDVQALGRHDSWEGVRAVVAGFGVSGFAAADNLNHLGAAVTALDESDGGPTATGARRPSCSRCSAPTVRLGRGRDRDPARRRRPGGHLARLEADRPAARPGPRPRRSRSGARSSWPGGCATRTTTRPWLA